MNHAKIEQQLEVIRKVAEKKEAELDARAYVKYNWIFKDAITFLKTQKVLLYGGQAIHELMPKKHKIYPPNTLPDIDVFAVNAVKIGVGIVSFLKLKGYDNDTIQLKEAMNKGTFKVFAQGMPIVDITDVDTVTYKRLAKHSVATSSIGLRIVNPQYLRLSMHMILSQSVDSHRWEKTYSRLVNFYHVFKPKQCVVSSSRPSKIPGNLLEQIYDIVRNSPYIVFGHRELENMLGKRLPMDTKVPKINIIVKDDVQRVARIIIDMLHDAKDISVSEVYPADKFMSDSIVVSYNKEPLFALFKTDVCLTYNNINGFNVASIHTLIRMYMSMLMTTNTKAFKMFEKTVECYANMASILEQKLTGKKRNVLQEFVTQCYGPVKGKVTLKREMIQRFKHNMEEY